MISGEFIVVSRNLIRNLISAAFEGGNIRDIIDASDIIRIKYNSEAGVMVPASVLTNANSVVNFYTCFLWVSI